MKDPIYFKRWVPGPDGVHVEPPERDPWQVAYSLDDLDEKLDGAMATVDYPAAPWYVQLWRRVFPLRMIEGQVDA